MSIPAAHWNPRSGESTAPLLDADSVAKFISHVDGCWVQDINSHRVIWANDAAVRILHAPSMDELLTRDVTPLSRTARTRLLMFQRRCAGGRVLRVQWTTYALGQPVTFLSEVRGYRADDGRICLFFRARDVSDATCAESLRTLAAARHSTASYFLFSPDGRLLEQNAASINEFGELEVVMSRVEDQFAEIFADPALSGSIRQQLQSMESVRTRAQVRCLSGMRWHVVVVQPVLDPVDGARVLHVESFDISDQVEAETRARNAETLMQRIADEFSSPVSYIDRDRVFRFVNRAYCRWVGRTPEQVVGRRVDEVEGADLVLLWQAHWPQVARGERINFESRRALGVLGDRWISVDGIPFREGEPSKVGPVSGAIVFAHDVHALKIAQRDLAASQQQMIGIADSLPVAVCKFDRDGRILFANRLFCEWFLIQRENVVGTHVADLVGADAYASTRPLRERAFAGESVFWRRFVALGERENWIDVTLAPAYDETGAIDSLIAVYTDVTARVKARQELSSTRSTLSSHLANTPLAVIELDPERRVKEWTGRASGIFMWESTEAVGRSLDELKLFDEDARARFLNELNWLDQATAERFTLQFRNLRRDGGAIYAEWHGSVLRDADGQVSAYLMLVQDISAKVAAEHHLQYVASHDLLTGLANRSQFHERLQADISRAHRHKRTLLIVLIDLDRFKIVNDSLGHQVGDSLLQLVATRLRTAVGEGDLIARSGGDEFMVLVDLEHDASQAIPAVTELRAALAVPFQLLNQAIYVTASVGASLYPSDAENATELIKHADWAMFRAKDAGRNSVQFYADALANDSGEQLSLESDLRRSIEANQLELHYQAKVDLINSRLTGAEALLRWRHPTRGLVPPELFIPLAEETGLIVEIGAWVITEACRQLAAWREQFGFTIQVAINLSAVQLRRPGLPDGILAELNRHGLPGSALMVEVTETSVVTDPLLAWESLQALRTQGVHAAIDDFGKGFSSLIQLKRLPIDALKIDGSFVRDLVIDRDDAAIVNAIIGLAHNLDLKVVAEGVETNDQLAFLKRSGCDEAQGYLIARPIPPAEFAAAFLNTSSAGN